MTMVSSTPSNTSRFSNFQYMQNKSWTDIVQKSESRFLNRSVVGANMQVEASVISNSIYEERDKNSRLVKRLILQLPNHGLPPLKAGDCIKVFYKNDPAHISEVAKYIKDYEAKRLVYTKKDIAPDYMHRTQYYTTTYDALENSIDLGYVRPDVLKMLQQKLQSANYSHISVKLKQHLNDILGNESLLKQCCKDYRLVDILKLFPDVLNINDIIKSQPSMFQRSYGAFVIDPVKKQIGINVSLLSFSPPERKLFGEAQSKQENNEAKRYGLCSKFLCDANIGDRIKVYVKPNVIAKCFYQLKETLDHNSDQSHNILMVGAGTGVSSFMSILSDIEETSAHSNDKIPFNSWLITGGRKSVGKDLICPKEIRHFLDSGTLKHFDYATSRPEQGRKQYMQDIILEKGEQIWKFINNGSISIYLDGDEKMVTGVRRALEKVAMKHGCLEEAEAKQLINRMAEINHLAVSKSTIWR